VGIGLKADLLRQHLAARGLSLGLLPLSFGQLTVLDLLDYNWGVIDSWEHRLDSLQVVSSKNRFYTVNRKDGVKTVTFGNFLGKEGKHGLISSVVLRPALLAGPLEPAVTLP
jgi:hypothetical protein